jgi:hypothetical protein
LEVLYKFYSKYKLFYRGGKFRKPGGTVDLLPGEEQKMYKLKSELTDLEREERLIDTHLRWMRQVFFLEMSIFKLKLILEYKEYL